MPTKKWKPALHGKAKEAFAKAQRPPPQTAKAVESAGRSSEMVKRTRPAMNGPRPPGFGGTSAAVDTHLKHWGEEHLAAKRSQPKKEMSLEDQQEVARLNEKLR